MLTLKENSNLILRFLFNKIITRRTDDDPVFLSNPSESAPRQIAEDFKYHQIVNYEASKLSTLLCDAFAKASQTLASSKISDDDTVVYDETDSYILYRGKKYEDIAGLVRNNKSCAAQAVALNIRYTYLRLLTHGLANDYRKMGYSPDDPVVEAFASAFNHFFTRYHSAFPDLETCFGSRGSFFSGGDFMEELIMVNPPFDISVMTEAIGKVVACLETSSQKGRKQSFMLTIPAWMDVDVFTELEKNKYTEKYMIVPKEKTGFIDCMRGIIIQPCNIINVTMSSKIDLKPAINEKSSIPVRFRPKKKITVAVVGPSNVDTDDVKMVWESMAKAVETTLAEWNLEKRHVILVSGGCSWADHVAVRLYLEGGWGGLTLYLPCGFDGKFEDTGKSHWAQNPGKVLNKYHADFSASLGIDSLGDLTRAVENGAVVGVGKGFHERNSLVARSVYLVAFSFGEIKGGTLDTYSKHTGSKAHHIVNSSAVCRKT